jgi:hypothetical protein
LLAGVLLVFTALQLKGMMGGSRGRAH